MASPKGTVVGLAWFDRKQWQRLADAVEDRGELAASYEQWQEGAVEAVRLAEQAGTKVERVHVEVESLVAWCKEKRRGVSAASCTEYVNELTRRRHRKAEGPAGPRPRR